MASKKWLEDMSKGLGRELEAVTLQGLEINLVQTGLVRCTFLVPQNLSDKDGNWDSGAMAVLVDDVAACTVGTRAFVKASVDFHLAFYSQAKIHEKVEIEAKIVGEKGRLISVVVEIKKKDNAELVAVGRVWMATDNINRYPQDQDTTTASKL
ncbi:4HBT domain-containing protein [Heracleum sosnowskyi]|uniref:Acyl-coenzyme A thioesterase 13 n=1 Tax=Heracleum sosnowskyi TaxID=360622 RepID=A0AAD8M7Y2_9APIA|nr:4HBT domain-containing protein [Heracleum sosnowskyi]